MTQPLRKKATPRNLFQPTGDGRNLDYDFETEAEMGHRCQCGEMLHQDCERCAPRIEIGAGE